MITTQDAQKDQCVSCDTEWKLTIVAFRGCWSRGEKYNSVQQMGTKTRTSKHTSFHGKWKLETIFWEPTYKNGSMRKLRSKQLRPTSQNVIFSKNWWNRSKNWATYKTIPQNFSPIAELRKTLNMLEKMAKLDSVLCFCHQCCICSRSYRPCGLLEPSFVASHTKMSKLQSNAHIFLPQHRIKANWKNSGNLQDLDIYKKDFFCLFFRNPTVDAVRLHHRLLHLPLYWRRCGRGVFNNDTLQQSFLMHVVVPTSPNFCHAVKPSS